MSTASEVEAHPGVAPQRLHRRLAWTLVVLSGAALVALAWSRVPWSWVPGATLHPPTSTEVFSRAQVDRAEAFSWPVRLLSWTSLAVSLAVAAALGFGPVGARLARRLGGGRRWWLVALAGTLVFCVAVRLATLPFALLVRQRTLDAGLTHQGILSWSRDVLVSWALTVVVSGVLVLLVVGLARRAPRRWFLPAGVLVVALTFAVSFVYPLAVEPLFNSFKPLPDGPLRTSILQLAQREGVPVDDVLVADASRRTTTLNAYVSGFGDTRRVVLYDNLVADLPPDQIRSVVAHELGHARHDDVLLGTTLGAVGALGGAALLALLLDAAGVRRRASVRGAGDPAVAALVLAALAWGSFLASPAQNTVSRAIEARADRAALTATQDPVAFDRLQRQLALHSLADPAPPAVSQFWFGSHPTVLQRIGIAEAVTGESYRP